MTDDQINRATRGQEIAFAVLLWCVPTLMILTWVALRKLPSSVVCSFRDHWYLQIIWPFNFIIYDQFGKVGYPADDQCLFIAGNSLFSAYFAIIILIGIWAAIRKLLRQGAPHPKQQHEAPMFKISLLLAFCLLGTWVCSYFHDALHGRYGSLAYRTYNSPGVLVAKTLLWMFVDYGILFTFAVFAIVRIAANRR